MMRILILIIMLLPCSLGMYASAIDSLLSVLDKTIVMRRQYEEEKERYISLIKDELKQGRLREDSTPYESGSEKRGGAAS